MTDEIRTPRLLVRRWRYDDHPQQQPPLWTEPRHLETLRKPYARSPLDSAAGCVHTSGPFVRMLSAAVAEYSDLR